MSTCGARRTLPVDLCEFILLTYSAEQTEHLTGYGRPTSGQSFDRINANMAILALQAYIAYFGTASAIASQGGAVEIMRDSHHEYRCAAGLADYPRRISRAGAP
jgi:hypothetical protein